MPWGSMAALKRPCWDVPLLFYFPRYAVWPGCGLPVTCKLFMNNFLQSLKTRPPWVWALPLLLMLDLLVYGHVLISGKVISGENLDLHMGIWGPGFVFSELRSGNLPLWNPYILSGTPAFANFQNLAFYP